MIRLAGTNVLLHKADLCIYNGSVFVKFLVSEYVLFSVFIYCSVFDDSSLYFCTFILSIDSVPQLSHIPPWQKLTSTVLVDSDKLF